MADVPVITIDGPSGSGKGTLGRRVAGALGWHFLDSGALYRVLALAALQRSLALDDGPAIAALAKTISVAFGAGEDVLLDGAEIGAQLRTESCGKAASRVAALPEVRAALLAWQRAFRKAPGVVADGRDMGTVVFPDAAVKVFLTASAEERARRRYKQLKEKGIDVSLSALSEELVERDRRDSARAISPLKAADDACQVDSTGIDIDTVVDLVLTRIEQVFARPSND